MTTIALTTLATVTGGATAPAAAAVPAQPAPVTNDRLKLFCESLDRAATKASTYSRHGDAATIDAISSACWMATED